MTVSRLLSHKGREIVSVSPGHSVAEAADLLATRRIGAVVVVDQAGNLAGILSERDLVRVMAREGAACLQRKVADVMTGRVVTCTGSTRIDEIMQQMTDGKFRHVPVMENGKLAGVISIGDVVKHKLAEIEAEKEALKEYIASA